MDAAEFEEYQDLCEIVWDEFTMGELLPDVRRGRAALAGAAADKAARVFYVVLGEIYSADDGADHAAASNVNDAGRCPVCRGLCGIPLAAANAMRFRRMAARLDGLSQTAAV